ncbi:hypothetical protein BC826DRAFT_1137564 [Russula brevipes]|nr:hypothetical protein BC826DRAFT_1137564 [Russula brevipes]
MTMPATAVPTTPVTGLVNEYRGAVGRCENGRSPAPTKLASKAKKIVAHKVAERIPTEPNPAGPIPADPTSAGSHKVMINWVHDDGGEKIGTTPAASPEPDAEPEAEAEPAKGPRWGATEEVQPIGGSDAPDEDKDMHSDGDIIGDLKGSARWHQLSSATAHPGSIPFECQ